MADPDSCNALSIGPRRTNSITQMSDLFVQPTERALRKPGLPLSCSPGFGRKFPKIAFSSGGACARSHTGVDFSVLNSIRLEVIGRRSGGL